ncbi:MAG: Oxidoreductase FAD-binding domain protein [Conexibacter sp.]|nr:Oxidoreductase FAD-binding domain protein [Conexibacter sp.]
MSATAVTPEVAVHTVSVEPAGVAFPARSDEPLMAAARRAGVWLPFECGWGSCATCKVTLVEGEVRSLFAEAPALKPQDHRRSRILACQSCAVSDLVIKTSRDIGEREDLPTADHQATLTACDQIGTGIRLLRFAIDEPAVFRPGQYAILEPEPGVRRAYSMSSLPGATEIEFVVKHYPGGAGTDSLFGLAPGAVVQMELPYGAAYHRASDQVPVFVAGGTGIGPIISMLRGLVATGSREAAGSCLLYGAPVDDELVLIEDLDAICTALDVRLVPVVERPAEGWAGAEGYVTGVLNQHLPGEWADLRYYVAGPPPMVNAALALLRDAGVQMSRIHFDPFG